MENNEKTIEKYCINNRLTIHVKPNAPQTEIISGDIEKHWLKIAVHAPPEDNKANTEVIKFFSRILKKRVGIIQGLTSKTKVLRIT